MAAAERHRRFVRLIVPGETEAVEDVNEFAKIYYIPAKYSPIFDKRYRLIMPWQYMKDGSAIRRILLEEDPDFVEITDKYTLSMFGAMVRLGKFSQLGRKMLIHFSCERMDDNIASFLSAGRLGKWFSRRVMADYLLPSFDFHIANSTYTSNEFFEAETESKRSRRFFNWCYRFFNAPRVPLAERVAVCPRGVNVEQFSPERRSEDVRREMRERAGIPDDAVVLLYAGRISPEKNIGLLVEMMKELVRDASVDFRLVVAGAGPLSEWLREEGEKTAPGRIIQIGHLDKETLANYYSNADVFVHPNPREPFGIAPLEAMASGVPTVAPNAGGILSYATNDNAWLVEPTGENFASAVREVIQDRPLRDRKLANALGTARQNTREASTDRLFAAYDKMYAEFQTRNELFTNTEAAKSFDFSREPSTPVAFADNDTRAMKA
jgi:glycosyltransferase involved in cell wall biosynthesis